MITRAQADVLLSAMTIDPPTVVHRPTTFARLFVPSPSSGTGTLEFIASAEGTNRYGFSLRRSGWRLDNFRRNPVILWNHDAQRPPIGRAVNVGMKSAGLSVGIEFDNGDEFAREVERKVRSGFLNALSVGFDFVDSSGKPLDMRRLSAEQMRDQAFYDLAEVSVVPVPADPNAVRQMNAYTFSEPSSELSRIRHPSNGRLARVIAETLWDAINGNVR